MEKELSLANFYKHTSPKGYLESDCYQTECKPCYNRRRRPLGGEQTSVLQMRVKKASFVVTPELAAMRELFKADRATRSNRQTIIKFGVVYIITNPAWPGWVSIGCAGDPEERLSQYNRCSPFRDFVCVNYGTTPTKRRSESTVHKILRSQGINGIKVKHLGEWFFMNEQDAVKLVKKICLEHSTNGGLA